MFVLGNFLIAMTGRLCSILVLSLLLFPPTSHGREGRASPVIPVSDPVYDDLDLLAAHGLVKTLMMGQRPFTRSEIGRLASEAQTAFEARPDLTSATAYPEYRSASREFQARPFIRKILERLTARFPAEVAGRYVFHPLEKATLEITYLDSPPRPYFPANEIDALYNPLVQNREGRHFIDGGQYSWETNHWALLGNHFSATFHPRLQLQIANDRGKKENGFFVQELYGSAYFLNTQIDFGRRPIVWGQSRHGGLVLSDNARPVDGITIFNPSPWKIRYLGNLRYTFFLATLGPEQNFKNALFSGIKLSLMPARWFEVGIARALIFGGEGSPSSSFADQLADYFGARPGDISNVNLSNSINGFELRGRIPPLRNLELYAEFYFDDFTFGHPFRNFVQDSGISGGIYLPRLDYKGSLSLRLEGKKTSSILYKHSQWNWALNHFVLGDPLGADAESAGIWLTKRLDSKTEVTGEFAFERIDSDNYQGGVPEGRRKTVDGTAEKRFRGRFGLSRQLTKRLNSAALFGYEHIEDFNFAEGNNRENFLFNLALDLDIDDFTSRKR